MKGAVLIGFGHAHDQSAPGVKRPARDVATGLFVDRFGFPSEGRFIDRTLAGFDFAVCRYQFSWEHDHTVSGKKISHRNLDFITFYGDLTGFLRRPIKQGVDGAARAGHGVMFDRSGGRKEEK